jgi:TRAP-type transport system small permease protein
MNSDRSILLDRIIDGLERVGIIFAGTLFILNVVNIVVAVFSRYVLLSSSIWTAELSRFIMVWMVLIAAAPALRKGEHMKIDLLLQYFPPSVNKVLAVIRHSLIIGISIFMTVWGFRYANSLWRITTLGLKVPKPVPLFAVPAGMLLFLIMYLLLRIARKPELHSHKEGI